MHTGDTRGLDVETTSEERRAREVDVRERLGRDAPWLVALVVWALQWQSIARGGRVLGYDAHAYWGAWGGAVYGRAPEQADAFLYSPAFAHLVWPVAQLPWPAFYLAWCALLLGSLWHLLSPLGWQRALPWFLACLPEVMVGNIYILFALVAAYGLRHQVLWALPALTKISPAVGPVWFLVRAEWRNLALALAAPAAIAAASYLVAPSLWADWFGLVVANRTGSQGHGGTVPVLLRVPVAVLVVTWGARTDRTWVLPVGMILATPVWGWTMVTVLTALPRLSQDGLRVGRPRGRACG